MSLSIQGNNVSDTTVNLSQQDDGVPNGDVEKASATSKAGEKAEPSTNVSESDPDLPNRMRWDPQYKVALDPEEEPKNMSEARKWLIVFLISSSALCVTSASSVVCAIFFIPYRDWLLALLTDS